jgi:peptidoglycan/xylan/chitin deacetylase (PgdA/CDA1 family)/GT2 family glycosyltransferase
VLSVVIPTHQQRRRLVRTLAALSEQKPVRDGFEVIVVIDGSTDGTGEELAARDYPFPLRVLEQRHNGQGAARNLGASQARGDGLVFFDDDVIPVPDFLSKCRTALDAGAEVVLGRLVLGDWVPSGPQRDEYEAWLATADQQLAAGEPNVDNIVFGATAVDRATFDAAGGFDEVYTAGGLYGAEDAELGCRLLKAGARFRYEPEAVGFTECETDARRLLTRAYQVGRNHVRLVRTHPEVAEKLFGAPFRESRLHAVVGPLGRGVPWLHPLLRWVWYTVAWLYERHPASRLVRRAWRVALASEHWRGVTSAGGSDLAELHRRPGRRSGSLRVLCYHAVADLDHDPLLSEYAVTAEQLGQQLRIVHRLGYRWVDLDTALDFLEGRRTIRRGVLVTFDDGYADFGDVGLPVLERQGVRPALFAVSGRLGDSNAWDERRGATSLRLLDAHELRQVATRGTDVGSHSRTHPDLTALDEDELRAEVAGSREDLRSLDGDWASAFAYPQGRHDPRVCAAVRVAGYRAAFTVAPGVARPGGDLLRIPRIEVHRGDSPLRFAVKVVSAGRSPGWEVWVRHTTRPLARRIRRLVRSLQ